MCTRCILKKQYTVGEFCWQALARCTAACPASVSWRDSGLLISVVLTDTGGSLSCCGVGVAGQCELELGLGAEQIGSNLQRVLGRSPLRAEA